MTMKTISYLLAFLESAYILLRAFVLGKFENFEVHPCLIAGVDESGKEIMEQCDEHDPELACWSLYGHYKIVGNFGGLECLADFETKAEAENAEELVTKIQKLMEAYKWRWT